MTALSLAGLAGGILAGVVMARWQPPGSAGALGVAEALIRAWTNAFRLLVAPLVVAQLYLALAGDRRSGVQARRLGVAIPLVFAGLLVLTATLSLSLTPVLLALPWFPEVSLTGAAPPVPAATPAGPRSAWVDTFVPPNLFAAATTDNILPLMLFTLVFALAMRRADTEARETMARLFRGVSQASFTLVGWLLLLTPAAMLALGYREAVSFGFAVGGAILTAAALEVVVILVALLALYGVVGALAVGGVGRFARALWPAQLTAMATRSSLATLPALLRGAEAPLGLRSETAATVLPLAGATLKLSRAVSSPVALLFLAHVLGITISPQKLVVFVFTILLLSTSTVGVPRVISGTRSLPAYVAVGIPAELVVLMAVVVSLTDVFRTVLNTSGYLAAATVVDRFGARPPQVANAPALDDAVSASPKA